MYPFASSRAMWEISSSSAFLPTLDMSNLHSFGRLNWCVVINLCALICLSLMAHDVERLFMSICHPSMYLLWWNVCSCFPFFCFFFVIGPVLFVSLLLSFDTIPLLDMICKHLPLSLVCLFILSTVLLKFDGVQFYVCSFVDHEKNQEFICVWVYFWTHYAIWVTIFL